MRWRWAWKVIPLLLLVASVLAAQERPEVPWTAADVWIFARDDAKQFPLDARIYYRYLSLANYPDPKERLALWHTLAGHMNGLSTYPAPKGLDIVPGSAGRLLRLNLLNFNISQKTWEQLAVEPYYHRTLDWPGGTWPPDGKNYAAGAFAYRGVSQGVTVGRGKEAVQQLLNWTYSFVPIVQGDWMVWQTAAQLDRKPGYYDMLGGVKTVKDFNKLIRYNAENSRDLERRKTVTWSEIAKERVRRVDRTKTVLGGYHITGDVASVANLKNKNPLDFLFDDFRPDASEAFGCLPNGMPVWFLGNAKGEAQAVAPPNIVQGDRVTNPTDSNLHVNVSCLFCHAGMNKAERMIKFFTAEEAQEFRALKDYKLLLEFDRLYKQDVLKLYELDRLAYDDAVKAATYGWDSHTYATNLARCFVDYDNRRVDLAQISRDFGYPADSIRGALQSYDAKSKGLPGSLSIVKDGRAIPVKVYHEFIPVLQDILYGEGVLRN